MHSLFNNFHLFIDIWKNWDYIDVLFWQLKELTLLGEIV